MHSTKIEILAHLKRQDGATVDGIASSLRLAPMTVRQHLMALERDGVVASEGVRRPTGRPHFRYRLTEDGHRRLADGYDRLLALLVEQTGLLEPNGASTPADKRSRLFRCAALALAQRHAAEVRDLTPGERVAQAVDILRRHGGFAEYHESDTAIELRDFGCVYREMVSRTGPCQWHEPFLAVLLGSQVREAEETDECATCCRYVVPAHVATPLSEGTQ